MVNYKNKAQKAKASCATYSTEGEQEQLVIGTNIMTKKLTQKECRRAQND